MLIGGRVLPKVQHGDLQAHFTHFFELQGPRSGPSASPADAARYWEKAWDGVSFGAENETQSR